MTHGIKRSKRGSADAGTVFLAMLFFCCLMCALPGTVRAAEAAAVADPVLIWQGGPLSIYAIQDRPGSMDLSLFSGPASPEERAGYFTDGKAPASISVFLIRAGDKSALIDAGFGDAVPGESGLLSSLGKLGLGPQNIDTVLLTHMHVDHIAGLLREKKRVFPNARIVVSKPELNHWLSVKDPDDANARLVRSVMAAYGTDFTPPFSYQGMLAPGLTAVDASGHTPGHTAFLFDIEGKKLLVLGDLVHAAALQFPLPDECAKYDMDAIAAAAARKSLLGRAADAGIEVAGMHLPFPGTGLVERDGEGFRLVPTNIADQKSGEEPQPAGTK